MHPSARSPRPGPRRARPARPHHRGLAAALVGSALAVLGATVLAAPASAHVDAEGTTAPTGITTVTFSFTHGCSGSPTTSLRVQLPAGTSEVQPQDPPGWTSTVTASELSWTGGSIPDASPGSFVAAMRLVGTTGDAVFLPTIQGCASGEEAWIEKTDDPEAENAAPRVVLTQTVAAPSTTSSGPATSTTEPSSTATALPGASTATAPAEENDVGLYVGLAAVAVIVVGAVTLYLRNRRPSGPSGPPSTPSGPSPS